MSMKTKYEKIYFRDEKLPYNIMAKSKRYAICVRKLNLKEDKELILNKVDNGGYLSFKEACIRLKKSPIYTIVDFKMNIRGTHTLIFNKYDFNDVIECYQLLIDLIDGNIEISKRNAVIL